MGVILDTSVLIAAERGQFDLDGFVQANGPAEPAGMAAITVSELLHGAERAGLSRRGASRRAFVDGLLSRFELFPFGLAEARIHASVGAKLAASGQSIGGYDSIIAATCLRLGYDLATLNTGEFSRVPGLNLADTARFAK